MGAPCCVGVSAAILRKVLRSEPHSVLCQQRHAPERVAQRRKWASTSLMNLVAAIISISISIEATVHSYTSQYGRQCGGFEDTLILLDLHALGVWLSTHSIEEESCSQGIYATKRIILVIGYRLLPVPRHR